MQKTINLRTLQHRLAEIIKQVDQGAEILITRRNRIVAKLSPAGKKAATVEWPDFKSRMTRLSRKISGSLSKVILDDRD